MYVVITENDESQWCDQTGIAYHFPKRALRLLSPGMKVVYYKGKLKDKKYAQGRLSPEMHYFGIAEIGKIYSDPNSAKGDQFAVIKNFKPFSSPVLSKQKDGFLEPIPENRLTNYWRDGTRTISQETYQAIVSRAIFKPDAQIEQKPILSNDIDQTYESHEEGNASVRYTTVYERNPHLRQQAVLIHGTTCFACGFNFKIFYGEYAENFIHVHHIKPISEFDGSMLVDPEKDLIPLCANCHSVIHRKKDRVLSVEELRKMIETQKILT
jgi:predicted HNH restriction endonuclease